MKLVVQIRSNTFRRWHGALLSRLAARPDTNVALDFTPQIATAAGVGALMQLEAVLHRIPRPGLASVEPAASLGRFAGPDAGADLVLALDGPPTDAGDAAAWHLTFDGVCGEDALLAALMARQAPLVAIIDASGAMVASGRPGSEAGGVLLLAFEDVLARITTLILAALDGAATALPHPSSNDAPGIRRGLPSAAARALAQAAIRRIYTLSHHAPHWRVGWRAASGADMLRDGTSEGAPWTVLPDDGTRFYADPFLIEVAGTTTMFVEDFSHRTQKGIIAAVAFGPQGPLGTPRPVLETASHLSYPHVFAHGGSIWMVPESSAARRIDLYRATAFPGGWVQEATLVDDVCASDATLVRRDGIWWMFATVRDGGGAFSDALHLWSAPTLCGPWRPHPRNPVMIDIASARPAGAFIDYAGALIRPVQDCRRGYGAALGFARIRRLDAEGFEQEMTGVSQGAGWRGRLHTYNRCGALETIDGSARVRKKLWGLGA